ncbi:MAG: peptide chain release factor 2 [Thermomicrobiales bacterium]|nr:peptide chain release factor 2 [Thermomicrobiales bacterium]
MSRCDFDLPALRQEIETLQDQSVQPGFWDDMATAQVVMRRLGTLNAQVERWTALRQSADDLLEFGEFAADDPELAASVAAETNELGTAVDTLELELTLSGPYDGKNALMVVHSGEGGVDAQDFAEMLSRMYLKWGARRGFDVELLDNSPGEEAGIKNATIEIRGHNAYGYAKSEAGSHRLVRLSPFDSAHRRHTAFALVEVLPEIDSDAEIDLRDEDIKMDAYRASGAGGQHVNKTSSAIRLTHIPTGIVVTCQNERSQMQNRESAMKILRARLLERKLQAETDERNRLKGTHTAAGFGNRIRSYVLHPYTLVNDHRTETSVGDVYAVLEGEIDPFIDAYLHQQIGQS